MANRKQVHRWGDVKAGDIISFRYRSKSDNKTLTHSIMVLNPRFITSLKDGTRKIYLIGIKLETSNRIDIRLTKKEVNILEKVGDFKIIDKKNNLYKLNIKSQFIINDIKGVKPRVYDIFSRSIPIQGQYRTYDYRKAKRSAVYLEPIRVFTEIDSNVDDPIPLSEEVKEKKKPMGSHWQRWNGAFAGKNLKGKIKAYEKEEDAKKWSKGKK